MERKIERKEFVIDLNIENEDSLYNSFDKFNKTLSDDVYSHIYNRLKISNLTDKIKIKINSNNEINMESFTKSYNTYIEEQINLVKKEKKLNTTKQFWLLGIGIVFILISLLLTDKLNVIFLQIVSTIGSFSIWESANSWLIESKVIKGKMISLRRLKNAKIE